jgi:uncharacterized SAM-binding protein YcdF (DUF218 family)
MIELVLFLVLFIFIAVFLTCNRCRHGAVLIGVILFWLLGSWLSGPLMRIAQSGYDPQTEPHFGPYTVIIVLGGGTEYDGDGRLVPEGDAMARIGAAANLYRGCKRTEVVCRVIVSGGNPQHHERAEADVYAPYLLAAGIRPSDLILDDTSRNTYENARNVGALLGPKHYDGLFLVTSALHMRRALVAFEGFHLHPQPVVASAKNAYSWMIPHPEGWIASNSALREMSGVMLYYVSRWLGLYGSDCIDEQRAAP